MAFTLSESADIAHARSLIRTINDYPRPGVAFRDITPLLADGRAMQTVARGLLAQVGPEFDVVAGVEARGFIFAGAVATMAGTGMVPIRKAGKLPKPAHRISYRKEYGNDYLADSPDLLPVMRVLLIDDILANGGTLRVGADLIEQVGARVAAVGVVMELEGLGGRELMPQTKTLFAF